MSTPYEQAVEAAVAALSGPRMVVGDTGSQRKRDVEEAIGAALPHLLTPIEALADEWQADLDGTGGSVILSPEARYCWGVAVRELRAALATILGVAT